MWWEAVKTGGDSGCTAASVGYPRRIRKGVIHSPRHTAVMESVSSNKNLAAWPLAPGGADARGRARSWSRPPDPRPRPHGMGPRRPDHAGFSNLGRRDSL